MIIIQLILYCLLFTAMVKFAVRGGAIDGLYFYPKSVQERAIEIGLTDANTVKRKRTRFMILFYVVMLAALLMMIDLWNGVRDFKTAYLQALLFDLTGFPPMDIFYGTDEVMIACLPDMQAVCKKYGVQLNTHIGDGMMHCWGAMEFVPEAKAVRKEYFKALT